ncbi:hypothetical protein L914_16202 [Phytophthora nicotianae]|uniref:Uncharacterized protein n=1 Tax=Phytophthora nicotianae TaxID=4792 RepID=W2MLK5_PHYNI|nr:hypothetical protein L914_16202 [Phytophthora nicotianae]
MGYAQNARGQGLQLCGSPLPSESIQQLQPQRVASAAGAALEMAVRIFRASSFQDRRARNVLGELVSVLWHADSITSLEFTVVWFGMPDLRESKASLYNVVGHMYIPRSQMLQSTRREHEQCDAQQPLSRDAVHGTGDLPCELPRRLQLANTIEVIRCQPQDDQKMTGTPYSDIHLEAAASADGAPDTVTFNDLTCPPSKPKIANKLHFGGRLSASTYT